MVGVIHTFDMKDKIEQLGIKNLAQVYTKLKYSKESHIEYSNNILNCLMRQNFMSNG
jgi:hypothetical protein